MSYQTTEHCDICGTLVTKKPPYDWEGVRFHTEREVPTQHDHMSGHSFYMSKGTHFNVREQRLHSAGSSGAPMPALFIPGVVCSLRCFKQHLKEWFEQAEPIRKETEKGRKIEL